MNKDIIEEMLNSDKSITYEELTTIVLAICEASDPENDKHHILEKIFNEDGDMSVEDRAYGVICWTMTTLLERINNMGPKNEC